MQKTGAYFSAATPTLELRHRESGFNSRFTSAQLTFPEYQAQTREMIRKVRSMSPGLMDAAVLEKIVDGNSPFSLEPQGSNVSGVKKKFKRGILLTHGLSDSPYFMRHLARYFQARGFRVLGMLLPGHGTRPGDLLNTRWQEWAKTVAYGTDRLAEEVDEVYMGGYSAGAALSLYQALQDNRVRGLFLFAPALDISHRAMFANLHKLTSWLLPRNKWLDIKPDKDYFKYESFTKNNAAQMYALTRALAKRLKQKKLEMPIFTVASEDDKSVNTEAIIHFMESQFHTEHHLVVYTADTAKLSHHSTLNTIEWVNSMFPEQKILSSSHTAILMAPDDAHYGVQGEYASCAHYYPDEMEKYLSCMQRPQDCWLGEINEKNLKAGLLRRLMYNPNFESLKTSLNQFIDKLPQH